MSCPERHAFVRTGPGTFTMLDHNRGYRSRPLSLGPPPNRNLHGIGIMENLEKSFHELLGYSVRREWDERGHTGIMTALQSP